jgi:hypothetical protein
VSWSLFSLSLSLSLSLYLSIYLSIYLFASVSLFVSLCVSLGNKKEETRYAKATHSLVCLQAGQGEPNTAPSPNCYALGVVKNQQWAFDPVAHDLRITLGCSCTHSRALSLFLSLFLWLSVSLFLFLFLFISVSDTFFLTSFMSLCSSRRRLASSPGYRHGVLRRQYHRRTKVG